MGSQAAGRCHQQSTGGQGGPTSCKHILQPTAQLLAQPSCGTPGSKNSQPRRCIILTPVTHIKKITALCYSRRFACCKTIVINHRPISAAILKFALPGVVMFQPFFFFLLHFFFFSEKSNQFRVTSTSQVPTGSTAPHLPKEKRQIPLKAKAQRCSSLPLTWQVTAM